MQKIVTISHQSLKKGNREGKNIPPGQIPLYGDLYYFLSPALGNWMI